MTNVQRQSTQILNDKLLKKYVMKINQSRWCDKGWEAETKENERKKLYLRLLFMATAQSLYPTARTKKENDIQKKSFCY